MRYDSRPAMKARVIGLDEGGRPEKVADETGVHWSVASVLSDGSLEVEARHLSPRLYGTVTQGRDGTLTIGDYQIGCD